MPYKLYYDKSTHTADIIIDNQKCLSGVKIAPQNLNDPFVIECLGETALRSYILDKKLNEVWNG